MPRTEAKLLVEKTPTNERQHLPLAWRQNPTDQHRDDKVKLVLASVDDENA
jgi:hypothetical protein